WLFRAGPAVNVDFDASSCHVPITGSPPAAAIIMTLAAIAAKTERNSLFMSVPVLGMRWIARDHARGYFRRQGLPNEATQRSVHHRDDDGVGIRPRTHILQRRDAAVDRVVLGVRADEQRLRIGHD